MPHPLERSHRHAHSSHAKSSWTRTILSYMFTRYQRFLCGPSPSAGAHPECSLEREGQHRFVGHLILWSRRNECRCRRAWTSAAPSVLTSVRRAHESARHGRTLSGRCLSEASRGACCSAAIGFQSESMSSAGSPCNWSAGISRCSDHRRIRATRAEHRGSRRSLPCPGRSRSCGCCPPR